MEVDEAGLCRSSRRTTEYCIFDCTNRIRSRHSPNTAVPHNVHPFRPFRLHLYLPSNLSIIHRPSIEPPLPNRLHLHFSRLGPTLIYRYPATPLPRQASVALTRIRRLFPDCLDGGESGYTMGDRTDYRFLCAWFRGGQAVWAAVGTGDYGAGWCVVGRGVG